MLGLRVLTGVPLAVAAIWFVLTQSSDSLLIALIVIAALAGWEWAALAKARTVAVRIFYALVLAMTVWVASQIALKSLVQIQIATVVIWIGVTLYLSQVKSIKTQSELSGLKLLSGIVVIVPAMIGLWMVHRFKADWLLFGMSLVWVADIGAYFAGRKFGRKKLAPVLSPGKTREGFYGALSLTILYSLLASVFYFKLDFMATVLTLLMTLVLTVLSVTGDLTESLLKRQAGVKDSGKILPGHGGILDRIDSLTATMSLLAVATIYIFNLDWFLI